MTEHEQMKEKLLDLVASSPNQRLRPIDAEQIVAQEFDLSTSAINEVVKGLVEDGELVYTYRDPCSYLEIPCNGCDGGHRAARPMTVVTDHEGNPWICDDVSNPLVDHTGGACWECGSLAFTRAS